MHKINLALQFWEGDKARAMHLARFIADLEVVKNENVDFTFVARFDTGHDDETCNYVAKKFSAVHRLTSRKYATGWPAGCNAMALDLFEQSAEKRARGEWAEHKALYLIESDVMPLCREWLSKISDEWDKAQAAGKFILGSWNCFHGNNGALGHINGNLLASPDIARKIKLHEVPARSGWDAYLSDKFSPHWYKSVQMSNPYDIKSNISEDILWMPVDGVTPPVVVHGVKDFSAESRVREKLGL